MPYRNAYTLTNSDGYIAKRDTHVKGYKKNLATIACNKVSGWKMGFEPTT